ncbi:MAG: hypothetical protein G4A98_02110 [Buchnera aphidicola (Microlophium carnosum)]|uniref:Uncharacterized protein n=1 Tax=Buchnera aphidicola (Microlophium carnosum) TaxID=2708354 RepID=A0A6G9JTU0_9GAMM|nr:MAG: hypothetical protein G4A98_02110 [Buchnera aphidicola (Microlophium carnosum)]
MPISICQSQVSKKLYKKAHTGRISVFTNI